MLRAVGAAAQHLLADTGQIWRLAVGAFDRFLIGPFRGDTVRYRAILEQTVRAGNRSLPLVGLITFLVGMIIALQSAYQLRELGAMNLLGGLVGLAVTRELAPLLTAIIVAGRFGSAIAAELGTMKVSQEIDALTVMGLDPVGFLVVPRLVALLVAVPCLTIFADAIGILGGLSVATGVLQMNASVYLADTVDSLVLQDIFTGLVKAIVFAGIIGLVGCHQGLRVQGGAEQVGHATTTSVVRSIMLVIVADLFVTAIFFLRG
jgi:phospholipid/cholesterol/gamma-HCH transport system permease protein